MHAASSGPQSSEFDPEGWGGDRSACESSSDEVDSEDGGSSGSPSSDGDEAGIWAGGDAAIDEGESLDADLRLVGGAVTAPVGPMIRRLNKNSRSPEGSKGIRSPARLSLGAILPPEDGPSLSLAADRAGMCSSPSQKEQLRCSLAALGRSCLPSLRT
jgi:hypothetical protein